MPPAHFNHTGVPVANGSRARAKSHNPVRVHVLKGVEQALHPIIQDVVVGHANGKG